MSAVVLRDAIAFQSDLDEVLAEPPPRALRATNALLAALLATVIAIAASVHTDVVVTGRGQLRADTPTILMQPMERSLIRAIFVRAGDRVAKGQVVATLDPTFAQADMATLRQEARETEARLARLQAELAPVPPDSLPATTDEESMQALLYQRRREAYQQHLASFDQTLARTAASLRGERLAASSAAHQLEIASNVSAMRSALMQSAEGSKLQFLEAETSRVQIEKELATARGHIAELTHAIDAARADRQAFVAEHHRQALDDLIAAQADQQRVQASLSKATRLHDLIRLVSPADGIVLDVAPRSAGSVLREAEALVTILPQDAAMIAEISVASADIGSLAEGQKVLLKVDAFPYQRHGMVRGVVRSIGEESFADAPGETAFHRVRIALTNTDLRYLPKGASLFPGMTVMAEVNVGARNLLTYFLYPVTRGFEEGMREP
jgi:HlyD family secretion protein